jgi:hypothetical protein
LTQSLSFSLSVTLFLSLFSLFPLNKYGRKMTNAIEFVGRDGPVGPLADLLATQAPWSAIRLLDIHLTPSGVAVLAVLLPAEAGPVRYLLGEIVPQSDTIRTFWNVAPFQPLCMVGSLKPEKKMKKKKRRK